MQSVQAHGLFGLYQGVPRTSWAADHSPCASKITIFRGPLLRASRTPDDLARRVTETVHHEIAHQFGISDERLASFIAPAAENGVPADRLCSSRATRRNRQLTCPGGSTPVGCAPVSAHERADIDPS